MAATTRLTAAQVQQFHDQGFVIVRGAFSAARVARLRQAVEGILARVSAGEATAISWINEAKQLPARMGDFMADPSHFSLEFTDWLAEDAIPHLQQLIANGETRGVRHCRFQMLAGGDGQAYRQGWHRDQRFVDPEGHFGAVCDAAGAAFRGRCVEWNAPLVEGDSFFNCVPGSHRRPNTDEETAALLQDRDAVDSAPMPGATVVRMEPGDVCYFDAGMLHRGWNPEGRTRWTLHNVTWGADVPVFFDYDPLDTGGLVEILASHGAEIKPAAREYLLNFLEGQRRGEAMERPPSIYDMWMQPSEADEYKATVHNTGMGPTGKKPANCGGARL